MQNNETKTQTLLRNAKEALAAYRDKENEARKALAMASDSVRVAKEKYEALFLQNEKEVSAKPKATIGTALTDNTLPAGRPVKSAENKLMKLKCIRSCSNTGKSAVQEHRASAKIGHDREIWIHLDPGVTGYESAPKKWLLSADPSKDWVACAGTPGAWDSLTVPAVELERLREVLRLVPDPNN